MLKCDLRAMLCESFNENPMNFVTILFPDDFFTLSLKARNQCISLILILIIIYVPDIIMTVECSILEHSVTEADYTTCMMPQNM